MGGASRPRAERLHSIGIALQTLVRTEDTFVREAQQDFTATVGWNIRRSEFLTTIWKMKSKIRDLITELAAQMSKINNLFNIAKAMKTDSDVKTVPWSVVYAEMKRKATAYDEIRTLISNSRSQMDRLCLYKNQVKRLANKVSSEEEEYKAHRVTSIRIRDSELDESTTRSYILLAREVCLASCELILEHKELMLEFQQSSLRFRENCLINYEYHYSRAIESTRRAKEKEASKAQAAAAKLQTAVPAEGSPKRSSKRLRPPAEPEPHEIPEKKLKQK